MPPLVVEGLAKTFNMHLRDGLTLTPFARFSFHVERGECVVLGGASGAGKSSVLKMIYGSYVTTAGRILVATEDGTIDVTAASPQDILRLRRATIGYVSQFLAAPPRLSARDVATAPLIERGMPAAAARTEAECLLARLNIDERLWSLSPATFSGGEQQRINIARGFIADYPILLLDEPSASLDSANRQILIELIEEKRAAGSAILSIFHDAVVRDAIADRVIEIGNP